MNGPAHHRDATNVVAALEAQRRIKTQRLPRNHFENMTATKPQPSAVVLASRKHFLASVQQGISPDDVARLSAEELLSMYGEDSSTPLGRIRQTLNTTFTGEALAAASKAVDEYAAIPQEYAKHSLSVADVVTLALADLGAGVGLPESARTKIDAEQDAVAVLRRIGL
jgi:hypothetical protein